MVELGKEVRRMGKHLLGLVGRIMKLFFCFFARTNYHGLGIRWENLAGLAKILSRNAVGNGPIRVSDHCLERGADKTLLSDLS